MLVCCANNVVYGAAGSHNAYRCATVVYTVTAHKYACALCVAENELNVAYSAILENTTGCSRTEVVTNDTTDSGSGCVSVCIFCSRGGLDNETVNGVADHVVGTCSSSHDTTDLTSTENLNILNCRVRNAKSVTLAKVTNNTTYVIALFGRAVYALYKAGICAITNNRAVLDVSISLTCKTTNRVFTGDLNIAGYVAIIYSAYGAFKLTYESTYANKAGNLGIIDINVLDYRSEAEETGIVSLNINNEITDSMILTVEGTKELSGRISDRLPAFAAEINVSSKYNELIIEGRTCVNHIAEYFEIFKRTDHEGISLCTATGKSGSGLNSGILAVLVNDVISVRLGNNAHIFGTHDRRASLKSNVTVIGSSTCNCEGSIIVNFNSTVVFKALYSESCVFTVYCECCILAELACAVAVKVFKLNNRIVNVNAYSCGVIRNGLKVSAGSKCGIPDINTYVTFACITTCVSDPEGATIDSRILCENIAGKNVEVISINLTTLNGKSCSASQNESLAGSLKCTGCTYCCICTVPDLITCQSTVYNNVNVVAIVAEPDHSVFKLEGYVLTDGDGVIIIRIEDKIVRRSVVVELSSYCAVSSNKKVSIYNEFNIGRHFFTNALKKLNLARAVFNSSKKRFDKSLVLNAVNLCYVCRSYLNNVAVFVKLIAICDSTVRSKLHGTADNLALAVENNVNTCITGGRSSIVSFNIIYSNCCTVNGVIRLEINATVVSCGCRKFNPDMICFTVELVAVKCYGVRIITRSILIKNYTIIIRINGVINEVKNCTVCDRHNLYGITAILICRFRTEGVTNNVSRSNISPTKNRVGATGNYDITVLYCKIKRLLLRSAERNKCVS